MVRLVQCLCPQRHCLVAFAYEPGLATPDGLTILDERNASAWVKSVADDMFGKELLDPWCGICGSRELVYEDRPTRFKTLSEASPALKAAEDAQIITRNYMKHSRN